MGVPSDDEYHLALRDACEALLSRGYDVGRAFLRPIAKDSWGGLPTMALPEERKGTGRGGRSFSAKRSAETFVRDGFICRYCGREVVPRPIAEMLSRVYPSEIPFHRHYKTGCIHPLFWTRVAEADHIYPGSLGGAWEDPENHATACVACNARKGNYTLEDLGWDLRPWEGRDDWDGLISMYQPLRAWVERADARKHDKWMRAFGLDGGIA